MSDSADGLLHEKRVLWIDNLRGIGISFIVLGHAIQGGGSSLEKYVYSMHLPLFFFLSGLLQNDETLNRPLPRYARNLFRSLLVPYLTFGLLTYVLWIGKQLFLSPHSSVAVGMLFAPLAGMLYGVHGEQGYLAHNGALWFLPCLFMMHLFFFVLRKKIAGWMSLLGWTLLCSSSGVLLASNTPHRMPWGIDLAMICLPFFMMGYLLRTPLLKKASQSRPAWRLLLLLPAHFFLQHGNSLADLNILALGKIHLFFLAAATGALSWVPIAQLSSRLKMFTFWGKNSIVIFTMNSALMYIATSLFRGIGLDALTENSSLLGGIARSIVVLLLAYPVVYIIKLGLPWMLPGRPSGLKMIEPHHKKTCSHNPLSAT